METVDSIPRPRFVSSLSCAPLNNRELNLHSASLPPINHFDLDRVKREDSERQKKQEHSPNSMPNNPYPSSFSRTSSLSNYSHSSPSHGPAPLSSILSPESRRPSGEDTDAKQSDRLPSIHEALNSDQRFSRPSGLPAPTSAPLPQYPRPSSASPSDPPRRIFAPELPAPGPSYPASNQNFRHGNASTVSVGPTGPPDSMPRTSFTSPGNSQLPALQLKTMQSPIEANRAPYSYSAQPVSAPVPDPGPSSASRGSFGYTNAPSSSNHPYSAPPHNTTGPSFTPSSTTSTSPRYGNSWQTNEVSHVEESKRNGRFPGPTYGESVKRHLDNFDLEASLNEIAEGSGRMLDFTRVYGARAHQTQRSGSMPGTIPAMAEVDNLLQQTALIEGSLRRILELIHSQQAAMAERAQESRFKAMNSFEEPNQSPYPEETKGSGGFAGSDAKKQRKGRAAPPGRCHSCNRAETPEWRRGPDGARTLCNACGLHYAKLTRKMGTNKAAIGNSNLRPKSLGPGSPAA